MVGKNFLVLFLGSSSVFLFWFFFLYLFFLIINNIQKKSQKKKKKEAAANGIALYRIRKYILRIPAVGEIWLIPLTNETLTC